MAKCSLCNQDTASLTHEIEQWVIDRIRQANPKWIEADGGCAKCIAYYESLDTIVQVIDPKDPENS